MKLSFNAGVKLREAYRMKKQKLPPEVLEYFRRQVAKGGKLGGSKACANEERSARAIWGWGPDR